MKVTGYTKKKFVSERILVQLKIIKGTKKTCSNTIILRELNGKMRNEREGMELYLGKQVKKTRNIN